MHFMHDYIKRSAYFKNSINGIFSNFNSSKDNLLLLQIKIYYLTIFYFDNIVLSIFYQFSFKCVYIYSDRAKSYFIVM